MQENSTIELTLILKDTINYMYVHMYRYMVHSTDKLYFNGHFIIKQSPSAVCNSQQGQSWKIDLYTMYILTFISTVTCDNSHHDNVISPSGSVHTHDCELGWTGLVQCCNPNYAESHFGFHFSCLLQLYMSTHTTCLYTC